MIHLASALFSFALSTGTPELDAGIPSQPAIRCAQAIDQLAVEAAAIVESWMACGEPHGWYLREAPALAHDLDARSQWFAKVDAVLADPHLDEAAALTQRMRELGSPSLMDARNLCNLLCAAGVIAAHRGDSTEAARRLEQAVHLGLAMNADASFGRAILGCLSGLWTETLRVMLELPTIDLAASRTRLDARLACLSTELDRDTDRAGHLPSTWTQRVRADLQLMRSALAVSAYRRESGDWPESIDAAFSELDGAREANRGPAELSCLRRTSTGVCIFALVDSATSPVTHRLSISLKEPSDCRDLR